MRLIAIWAMDKNRLIGNKNRIPWYLPADFAHFKKVTMGFPIIMGRKTYESIGHSLPGRQNIILTRNKDLEIENCDIINSYEDLKKFNFDTVYVIGGSEVYSLLMPHIDTIVVTEIDHEFEGDAYAPEIDLTEWELVSYIKGVKDERNIYDHYFKKYKRKNF